MIDIHCHIVPGVDDGAKDEDTALKMARVAANDGIHIIVTATHYIYGLYENSFRSISEKVQKLNHILLINNLNMKIFPGQEVFLDNYTLRLYKEGIIRGLNDSRYILVELPVDKLACDILESIYEIRLTGAEVIIAHPERYTYIVNKPSLMNDFIEEGCLFQINAGSILGKMGKHIKKTSEILIKNNMCNFIATDAHDISRRSPVLEDACKHIDKNIKKAVIENAEKLIEDKEIQSNSEKIYNRRFFSFYNN